MHSAVPEVASSKTVVILCPASPCARELNGTQISTGWAVIFSLEWDWKSKWMCYTLKCKTEERVVWEWDCVLVSVGSR